jgi:plastocyanin
MQNKSFIYYFTFNMKHIAASKCLKRALLLAVSACSFGFLSIATAATVTVDIIDYAYTPDPITINVNDTVNWIWEGDAHSTTSVTNLWDSGVYDTGHTYSYTFTSPGSSPYYCTIHFFYGTVNVQAVSAPPTVAITNPADGLILSAPATISLSATATDADASSASVQFFNGPTALGTLTNAPYSVVVSNLAAGNYTFSAVATDDMGLKATNSITLQVVNSVPIMLTVPQRTSPKGFQFSYSAVAGLSYAVDRSALLSQWTPLKTNMAASSVVLFQDNSATASASYYRVRQMPNP